MTTNPELGFGIDTPVYVTLDEDGNRVDEAQVLHNAVDEAVVADEARAWTPTTSPSTTGRTSSTPGCPGRPTRPKVGTRPMAPAHAATRPATRA
jgi:hypothetical protein